MKQIPQDYRLIKSTPFYNNATIPLELTVPHLLLMGSFARLSVMEGAVKLLCYRLEHSVAAEITRIIRPGEFTVVGFDMWYVVEMYEEDTVFNIDFFDKVSYGGRLRAVTS